MKNETKSIIITLAVFMAIVAIAIVAYFVPGATSQPEPAITKTEISADVEVVAKENFAGFNTDKDALHFGMVSPGSIGERRIVVTNDGDYFKRKVTLIAQGELARWIFFPENGFVLKPKESKKVAVQLWMPDNAAIGNHNGKVVVMMARLP